MTKKILKLEKRGCDFWNDSQEKKESDLQNYRLFGYVSKHECIEVTTHTRKKSKYSKFNIVVTYIDNEYEKKELWTMASGLKKYCWGSYRDLKKCGCSNKPTKKSVLEFVNKTYNKKFTDIEIVDRL